MLKAPTENDVRERGQISHIPSQGFGYSYKYLQFMQDPSSSGLTLQEQLNNKGDFAKLMNIVPEDSPIFLLMQAHFNGTG